MSAEGSSRTRPRWRFTGSLEPLESRSMLSAMGGMGGGAIAARDLPTTTVGFGPYDPPGDYIYASKTRNLGFNGVASSPGVRVDVFALTRPRGGRVIPLGSVEPRDGNGGVWQLLSDDITTPLTDNRYWVRARAVDVATGAAGPFSETSVRVVVDNVPPRIVAARVVPSQGRVVMAIRDYGGYRNQGTGLDMTAAQYPYSYSLATAGEPWPTYAEDLDANRGEAREFGFRGLTRVVLTVNDGAPIPDGNYRLFARSPGPVFPDFQYRPGGPIHGPPYYALGVVDKAGNALDGNATSTVTPPDSTDFAAGFIVSGGVALPVGHGYGQEPRGG